MSPAGSGIFVSYRREDSSYAAGRLSDRLIDRFGPEQVFIDVEAIEPGVDFAEAISGALNACVVLLAVISPGWLQAADGRGRRRLDDPDDLVRLEIGTALERGVRVIPVLVEGTAMPGRDELPAGLAGLARRNALRIRYESFRDDAARLVAAIERVLTAAAPDHKALARAFALADEAERAARTQPEYPQALALLDLGHALAPADPGRAVRLFAEAERIADTLADPYEKSYALIAAAAIIGTDDAGRATQLIERAGQLEPAVTDRSERDWLHCGLVSAVTVTDPARAGQLAGDFASPYHRAAALSAAAGLVAGTDRERAGRLADEAEHIARTLPDIDQRAWVLSTVAEGLALADNSRAVRLADEANRMSEAPGGQFVRQRAVVATKAVTDPDEAERMACAMSDGTARALMLASVVRALTA